MGQTSMMLREGANGETVTLQASAPPYVLCRDIVNLSNECQIQIQVQIMWGFTCSVTLYVCVRDLCFFN